MNEAENKTAETADETADEQAPRKAGRLRAAWTIVHGIPIGFLIGGVRLYQIFLSPLLGKNCRFHPSCSNYFIQAVRKYGAISGTLKGIWRICRCNPFNPGGYDPP